MKITLTFLAVFALAAIAIFLISSHQTVRGGLKWKTVSQEFTLPAGTSTHSTSFAFKNSSNQPVNILSVKPDCNCLVPQIAQTIIPPGAVGEIAVIFNPGDRAGTLQRSIEVRTKEFPDQMVTLQITYHIPELIRISHRLLSWDQKNVPTPQEIELTMPDDKIKVTGVRSSNSDFSCEVIPVSEGRDYKVKVTPLDVSSARQSILLIDTDYPKAPWNRIVANVKVQ